MTKVSFAKVPGAGSSAPASDPESPAQPANAEVVSPEKPGQPAGNPQNLPVPRPSQAPVSSRFFGGDEEEDHEDRSDVRLPRLNIIQGLSGADLKSIKKPDGTVAPDGSFVLKKMLYVPQGVSAVVAGFSKKVYVEKMPKFGEGKPRLAETLEKVVEFGGTDQWKFSRENKDSDGMPVSRKPWFVPMVTALLLLKKWDGLSAADEEHFAAVSEDGIAFAPCVFTLKSTSFGSMYVPLKTEQISGVLSKGFYTRYVTLTTRQKTAFEPVATITEPTSEAVRKLAVSIRA